MPRRIILPLVLALAAAGVAEAQYGGGMGGGIGGHRGGRRHQQQDHAPSSSSAPDQPRGSRPSSLAKVQITGVIRAIDAAQGRVTIAYEPVDALNWPAGTLPFLVEKPSLLDGLTVGEAVRFHLESQQIATIEPIGPSGSPGTR